MAAVAEKLRDSKNLPPVPNGRAAMEARNALLIQDYTSGIKPADLAKKHEVSLATVYRVIAGDEPQEIIKGIVSKYLSHAEEVSDRFMALTDSNDQSIRLKAIQEYHKITGVSPSHTPSPILQQVINAENVQVNQDMGALADFIAWRTGVNEEPPNNQSND